MDESPITRVPKRQENATQASRSFEVRSGLRRWRIVATVSFGLLAVAFAIIAAIGFGWLPHADFLLHMSLADDPGFTGVLALITAGIAVWQVWSRLRLDESASEDPKGFTLRRGRGAATRLDWSEIAEVEVAPNVLTVVDRAGQPKLSERGPPYGNALVDRIVRRLWSRLPAPPLPATFAPTRGRLALGTALAALAVGSMVGFLWHGLITAHAQYFLSPAPEMREVWFGMLAYSLVATVTVAGALLCALRCIVLRVTLHPDHIEIRHPFRASLWRFADIDRVEVEGAQPVLVSGRRHQRLIIAYCPADQQMALARAVFAVLGGKGAAATPRA